MLSGGRFSEVVYTILQGHASGSYPAAPTKPRNFVDACMRLEQNSSVPRSFQILIPRILPALYEIRNNSNVGHFGGDVDPDFMDSSAVVTMSSWILAELIRVFHGVTTAEAQNLVNNLTEVRHPAVWTSGDVKRILKTGLKLKDQVLLLVGASAGSVSVSKIYNWTEYKNLAYLKRLIRQLHTARLIQFNEENDKIDLLPPGTDYVNSLLKSIN